MQPQATPKWDTGKGALGGPRAETRVGRNQGQDGMVGHQEVEIKNGGGQKDGGPRATQYCLMGLLPTDGLSEH